MHVDGQRVKPARNIKPGTLVRVRKAGFEISVEVLELAPQRGPAVVAQTLYRETPDSQAQRALAAEQRKLLAASLPVTGGRPTKRDRRQIHRFVNRNSESN